MKNILVLLLMLFTFSISFSQSDVYLKINHKLDDFPFAFNDVKTNNIGDYFDVVRLQYYISSISITHDGGSVTNVADTWLLVDAGAATNEMLGNFNITNVESITFSIGVEPSYNHLDPSTYPASHPLAPKSPNMHWGWSSGYKFVVIEGQSGSTSSFGNFYGIHGLGDVNYFSQTITTTAINNAGDLTIELDAEYVNILKDIHVASGVISHGEIQEANEALINFRDNVFTAFNPLVSLNENENNQPNFSLAPNPVNSVSGTTIIIDDVSTVDLSISITTIQGKLVQELEVSDSRTFIDGLETGVYFVILKDKKGFLKSKKLIVR